VVGRPCRPETCHADWPSADRLLPRRAGRRLATAKAPALIRDSIRTSGVFLPPVPSIDRSRHLSAASLLPISAPLGLPSQHLTRA
jgi:hypothetical protein